MTINIKDLIDIIPQIMMYFVPGYIAIVIKKYFRSETTKDEKHTVFMSIITSYLIKLLLDIIMYLINGVWFKFLNGVTTIILSKEIEIISALTGAVIVGFVLTILPELRLSIWLRTRIFKTKKIPYSSVWTSVMNKNNKKWARVYMKDLDLGYVGKLKEFSLSSEEKEIYLLAYTSFKKSDFSLIDDYSQSNVNSVYINCKDIACIEILEGIDNQTMGNEVE